MTPTAAPALATAPSLMAHASTLLSAPIPTPKPAVGWRRLASQARVYLPDVAALAGVALCAVLAALLTGSLGGCGGGVGTEGTGSFASGTIAGYGSIIVNGVHFDETTAVVQGDDDSRLSPAALALGMVVQVTGGPITTTAGVSSAVASAVRTNRALVGPASAVDVAAGSLTVLGQTVWVSVDTVFDDRLVNGLAGIKVGQTLEVYGFYDSTRTAYAATRIAPAAGNASLRVTGPVAAVNGSQSFTIGKQTYLASTAGMVVGAEVQLNLQTNPDSHGDWTVSSQRPGDSTPSDRDGAEFDGLVSAVLSGTRFVVNGVTVDTSAIGGNAGVKLGSSVEISGALRAGVLVASKLDVSNGRDRVKLFELSGSISGLNTSTRRFVLRGTTVSYARPDIVFNNFNAAKLSGYTGKLKVKGVLSADGTLLDATEIEFDN